MLRASDILTVLDGAVKPLHRAPFAADGAIHAVDVDRAAGAVTVTLREGALAAAIGARVLAALEELPDVRRVAVTVLPPAGK